MKPMIIMFVFNILVYSSLVVLSYTKQFDDFITNKMVL